MLDQAVAPSTIDIEGAELAALKSLDFDKYYVRVLIVEFDRKQKKTARRVEELLAGKGYKVARTIGVNAFWVKEEELAVRIRQMAFAGEVNHIRNEGCDIVCDTVSVSFASGEDSRRRPLLTRLRQSFEKRFNKYIKKTAQAYPRFGMAERKGMQEA